VAPAFSLRFRFRHVWHNGGRDVGSLALQQPFAGLLTALPGLPMRCIFGVARQNQLGLLTHISIPPPHIDDLPPSVLLSMDDDAPSVMGSLELEDHDMFVIENVWPRCVSPPGIRDLKMTVVEVAKLQETSGHVG
jgi:hypothetical protein